MSEEEQIQKQVEAQARRVQSEESLPAETRLEEQEVTTEQELNLAKQEQERIRKYSDDTSD